MQLRTSFWRRWTQKSTAHHRNPGICRSPTHRFAATRCRTSGTLVGRGRCRQGIFRAETVDFLSACSCGVATWRMRPTRPIATSSERGESFGETPCARYVPSARAHVPAMTLDVPASTSVYRLLAADGRRMRTPALGRRPAIYTAFSGNDRHRFSAFWLRSKCSICSYQLNI